MSTARPLLDAPKPEVVYLRKIFRDLGAGKVRVPAFQRQFVWNQNQVLRLLQSVYFGYPIGSLLLWSVTEKYLHTVVPDGTYLPTPDDDVYPATYVLDGLQRCATLYSVFHHDDRETAHIFNVVFDLQGEEFLHADPATDSQHPDRLNLLDLFDPGALLQHQAGLLQLGESKLLVERSIALQSAFQEYLVPIVTIEGRLVAEVVEIFERVNSSGTRLSAVDFMRAATWSTEFDLSAATDGINDHFSDELGLSSETLTKAIAVVAGLAPLPKQMLALGALTPEALHGVVEDTRTALARTFEFLAEEVGLRATALLPYEGILLVLVGYFSTVRGPTRLQLDELARWFWAVSMGEVLRGRPDNHVGRLVERARHLAEGTVRTLPQRLVLTAADLVDKRFIGRRARSCAFATLFGKSAARSLTTAAPLPMEHYLLSPDYGNFGTLLDRDRLVGGLGYAVHSSRVFANVIAVSDEDFLTTRNMTPEQVMRNLFETIPQDAEAVLASQLIPLDAAHALAHGRYRDFLQGRAEYIVAYVSSLAAQEENNS